MTATTDFDDFYSARSQALVTTIFMRTGDLGRAEECVQEAFVRAWIRWHQLANDDPVAWVRTVAWRLAVSQWRALRRERSALHLDTVRGEGTGDSSLAAVLTVRAALQKLSHDQRDVVVLHYFEDLSTADIAAMQQIPINTVKSHLKRGRSALRALLEPADEGTLGTSGEEGRYGAR